MKEAHRQLSANEFIHLDINLGAIHVFLGSVCHMHGANAISVARSGKHKKKQRKKVQRHGQNQDDNFASSHKYVYSHTFFSSFFFVRAVKKRR